MTTLIDRLSPGPESHRDSTASLALLVEEHGLPQSTKNIRASKSHRI